MDELTLACAQELARDIGRLLDPTERPTEGTKLRVDASSHCAGMGVPVLKNDRLSEAVIFEYRHDHTGAMDAGMPIIVRGKRQLACARWHSGRCVAITI